MASYNSASGKHLPKMAPIIQRICIAGEWRMTNEEKGQFKKMRILDYLDHKLSSRIAIYIFLLFIISTFHP